MTVRRCTIGAFAVFVCLAACTGSATSDVPSATFATTPPTTVSVVATDPPPADAAETSSTSTIFVPADDLDVPTAAPSDVTTAPTSTLPPGPLPTPSIVLVDAGEFDAPVEVTSRFGDSRTFVVEQPGRIVAIDDISSEVVLDITGLTEASGEQGLLGLAFHPERDFAYVNFVDADDNTAIVEFTIDPVSAVFDVASFRELFVVEQPFGNHNGGELAFGPDGLLYIGLGDGGSSNDPERSALDVGSPLGKILRVDPLAAGDAPFTIPADNPFVGVDAADERIWTVGLRNPWRFSFDAATGDLWIGDVGQNDIEEIDFAPATNGRDAGKGLSFGWSAFEGNDRFNDDQPDAGHTPPRLTYSHDDGNCSVSGGAVYRGDAVPDLFGWFVYGDFCSGTIWGHDPTSSADAPVIIELATQGNLAAIAVGSNGDLFAVSTGGTVSRFAPA